MRRPGRELNQIRAHGSGFATKLAELDRID
jgi:hypothetical protein